MSTHVTDSDADRTARRRLWRFVLISAGVHLALMAVTSVGYIIHLVAGAPAGETAAPASATAAATAPAPAAGAATTDPAAVPPAPKAKDRDSEYFGAPETDPKKLQSGPDTRADLDALR